MCTCQRAIVTCALLGFPFAFPSSALAVWPDSFNQQIVVNTSNLNIEIGSAPDSAGGIITVFHHFNNSTGQDIHARRWNNLGQLAWGSGPVVICNANNDQSDLRVVPGLPGVTFMFWADTRAGNYDVYAQKIFSNGQIQFTANGAPLVSGAGEQILQHAIADGFGGFIIAYQQGSILSARRYDALGNSLWASAATISDTAGDRISDMISDGNGGCYVGLVRAGIGDEVVIQPISAAGNPDFDQLVSLNANGSQRNIRLARRSSGNVLAVWFDGGVSPARLVANEFVDPLVFSPNVPLATGAAAVLDDFRLATNGSGDPVLLYGIQAGANDSDAFVARVNTAGQLVFNTPLPILGANQSPDNLTETPNGTIRATYRDSTTGLTNRKLLAAQFSPFGSYQWHQQVTPSDAAFKSTDRAALIHGSQDSLIILNSQVLIPGTKTAALLRVRANGAIGGELVLQDLLFGQSTITATKKNRKATLMGDLVVRNGGNSPSNATTLVFEASPSPDPQATGRVFLFEVALPALQPGEQITLTPGLLPPKKPTKPPKVRKVKLPKAAKLTPHYLFIFLDPPDTNAELDENNNFYIFGPV